MPLARQLFPKRMAEALAALLAQRHSTAKQIARAYKIDPSTAENLRKGHLSVPTLEKVIKTEGWALWVELGREMIGHDLQTHVTQTIRMRDAERRKEEARDQRIVEMARDLRSVADLAVRRRA